MGKAWEPFEIVLRASLNRAGLVLGYDHTCRRCKKKGTPHVERHQDPVERRCPRCQMALWPVPVPRPMRFHDLRHTTATLLLRAGVDVHRVQKILRHKDVRTTTMIYGHLDVEDLRSAVNQLMPGWETPVFERDRVVEVVPQGEPAGLVTSLLQRADQGQEEAGTPDGNPVEIPASKVARPRGFEPLAFGFVGLPIVNGRWASIQRLAGVAASCSAPRSPPEATRVDASLREFGHDLDTIASGKRLREMIDEADVSGRRTMGCRRDRRRRRIAERSGVIGGEQYACGPAGSARRPEQ